MNVHEGNLVWIRYLFECLFFHSYTDTYEWLSDLLLYELKSYILKTQNGWLEGRFFFMVTCHYPLLSVIYNLYTCLASKINYLPYFLMYFPRKLFFFEFGNPKVTVYKCAETIQGRKLYEEIHYTLTQKSEVRSNSLMSSLFYLQKHWFCFHLLFNYFYFF